jgi:hypothetical protein
VNLVLNGPWDDMLEPLASNVAVWIFEFAMLFYWFSTAKSCRFRNCFLASGDLGDNRWTIPASYMIFSSFVFIE